ncbi:MAG: gamma-glutamyltransferase, partial [Planctomycetes bacterium]|nr:gamma-glutamyltransferase [Planctomycetota bacterium]
MKLLFKSVLFFTVFCVQFQTGFAVDPGVVGRLESRTTQSEPVYQNAVVAADHPLASQAGLEILKRGGNVVDAAVATSFALSVVRPASCGLGGGGFMVIWNASTQQAVTLDYRERAPQQATRNMFVDKNRPAKTGNALSRKGHLAFAVPGTVAGLCYAQKQYGTLTLKTVLQPAIRLAKAGIRPDTHQQSIQKSILREFRNNPQHRKRFQTLYKKYLNNGKEWNAADRFYSP